MACAFTQSQYLQNSTTQALSQNAELSIVKFISKLQGLKLQIGDI